MSASASDEPTQRNVNSRSFLRRELHDRVIIACLTRWTIAACAAPSPSCSPSTSEARETGAGREEEEVAPWDPTTWGGSRSGTSAAASGRAGETWAASSCCPEEGAARETGGPCEPRVWTRRRATAAEAAETTRAWRSWGRQTGVAVAEAAGRQKSEEAFERAESEVTVRGRSAEGDPWVCDAAA